MVVGLARSGALRSPKGGAFRAKRRARPTTAARPCPPGALFVPSPDGALAEKVYDAIKAFAIQTSSGNITNRRIFRLTFRDKDKERRAEVGKSDPIEGNTVIAILESDNCYMVSTPNRGVHRGEPVMIGRDQVCAVEDFSSD